MIFVTVGTHHQPFDRLVAAAEALTDLGEVVVQLGPSTVRPAGCTVHAYLPWAQQRAMIEGADAVLCHAAPATIFECWQAGLRPIVMPRDPSLGEHVDDHQQRFASRLGTGAHVVHDVHRIRALMGDPDVLRREPRGDRVIASAFVAAVSEAASETATSRRRRRLRALQAVKRWMGRSWRT